MVGSARLEQPNCAVATRRCKPQASYPPSPNFISAPTDSQAPVPGCYCQLLVGVHLLAS